MLKITNLTDFRDGRYGINVDGSVIIQVGGSEYHVHPDDLGANKDLWAAATRESIVLDDDEVAQINSTLNEWKANGNAIMGKDVIRPL